MAGTPFKEDVVFQDIGLYASAHSQTTLLINWSEYLAPCRKEPIA